MIKANATPMQRNSAFEAVKLLPVYIYRHAPNTTAKANSILFL